MSFWDNLDVYSSTNPASTFLKPTQPAIKVNVPFKAGLDINSPVPSATKPAYDLRPISPIGTQGYGSKPASYWDTPEPSYVGRYQTEHPYADDVQAFNTRIDDNYDPNTPMMRDGRPISTTDYYVNNNIPMGLGNKKPGDDEKGFWDEYLKGIGNYIKQNPLEPINALGSLWNGWQSYKNNREALKMAQRDYDLKKQAYYDQEARNKEAFAMQKRNWQGHQL